MEHSRIDRVGKKGDINADWICIDCGAIGKFKEVAAAPCEAIEKTSQERALLDAIGAEKDG